MDKETGQRSPARILALLPQNRGHRETALRALRIARVDSAVDVLEHAVLSTGYLDDPPMAGTVAVLFVEDRGTMGALLMMRSALEALRVLIVLDTSDHVLVDQAHALHPRVVLDVGACTAQLPMILRRLEG